MKTSVSVIAVMFLVTLLGFGVMAYAHSPGGWGGNMMGQGGHMTGQGSHMMDMVMTGSSLTRLLI